MLSEQHWGCPQFCFAHAVFDLLLELNISQGTSLVVVTHDLELAAKMQRQFKLQDGKLLSL